MAKMTSAYANKVIKKLSEDKEFWIAKENEGYVYIAALDEEPVIPDYNYEEVAKNIAEIDEKIMKLKHAINVANCTNEVVVGDKRMTIDMILVRMSQLNRRRSTLDGMRKQQPKSRINSGLFSTSTRKTAPEYRYINYDLDLIKKEYEQIDSEVAAMQIALDKYNQTVEFDVYI